jgi:hypothetical protein
MPSWRLFPTIPSEIMEKLFCFKSKIAVAYARGRITFKKTILKGMSRNSKKYLQIYSCLLNRWTCCNFREEFQRKSESHIPISPKSLQKSFPKRSSKKLAPFSVPSSDFPSLMRGEARHIACKTSITLY